ncbi:MAG: 16S rRNA (guanine(527)-N(7))-methyltransferase RsmG [Acidobacteriia bacterium]|nr:16S rRNA (guanine(527)-N(7))-methyltransferase RsmG [Terriglobia bacterium]
MNLTSVSDPKEIVYRHFCESVFAADALSIHSGRLADVGSGAGFPGLPLRIFRPELQVILIEANMKKATFLLEVIRELNLSRTKVAIGRFEEMGEELCPLDYVCSRALGDFDPFLKWAASDALGASQVVLWVGGKDMEVLRKRPEWDWKKPILIPHSTQRYLLVGERKQK